MQIANFQVFGLLVVVGLLIFFSSFLTLDLHSSVEELKKLPGHEFFHKPRVRSTSFLDATHNLKDFTAEESVVSAALQLSSRFNEFQHAILPTVQDHSAGLTHESVGTDVHAIASKQCSITFPQKCRINPLLKYWDEVMECYTSPLRQFNGLSAPKEKQKFVVFQPDSGGWNNIRMALEVVILFAQVRVLKEVANIGNDLRRNTCEAHSVGTCAILAACGSLTHRHRSLTVHFSRQQPVLV
jgi:hypothetical protein